MTGKDLFNGVNYIDEELLGEALDEERGTIYVRGRRRRNITQFAAMAASLAIVVLIGSTAYRNGIFNRVPGETPPSAASGTVNETSVEPAVEPVKDLYTED